MSEIIEIYSIIAKVSDVSLEKRARYLLRKSELEKFAKYSEDDSGFKKLAFDTRRYDEEETYNPRRGLRNYHRSEEFITEIMSKKIACLNKLKDTLDFIKSGYGKDPNWHDSYARILLSTIEKTLRTEQQDGDYSENQPSLASMDYVEEMLDFRYRLSFDELERISQSDLESRILKKDEKLIRRGEEVTASNLVAESNLNSNILKDGFGGLLNMREDVFERTITITVRDKKYGTT